MHFLSASDDTAYPLFPPRWRADDGSYLILSDAPGLRRDQIETSLRSGWRYGAAFGFQPASPVTLGEGSTPLLPTRIDGVDFLCKLEFTMPTGSFKDRGMTMLISYLKEAGIDHVLEDSSGNAGASLAAYTAAAGIRCRILVPEDAPYPKLVQMRATGAEVVTIRGSRQDVAEAALRQGEEIFYASHNLQPMFIEGTKTLAYELWEQLGFGLPDNIVVPLGYGANILGCDRGFSELLRNGEIDRLPRIFGVQAANCAPCHAAFVAGSTTPVETAITPTVAEGIASSKPTRLREIVQAIRRSNGSTVAVEESEIIDALGIAPRHGLFIEPTSAAALAGARQLLKDGVITPDQSTVLVLTGSGLKGSEKIGRVLGI